MRTVLITGTSSGIGMASAVEIARRGERVFASMRDLSRAGPLMVAAKAAGIEIELVQLDVTDAASVTTAVEHVLSAAGAVDVVVNNAGTAPAGPLEFTTDAEALAVFETNFFGPLRLVRAVLPSMRKRGAGRIVNLSSPAAHPRLGHRLMGLYSASKAALSALTGELCKELAPLGIDVVLMEGAVGGLTPMVTALANEAAERDVSASPYSALERVLQLQWPLEPPSYLDTAMTLRTAELVADACLMAEPPFIYPPEGQAWLQPADGMPDAQFKRLCAMDLAAELYEGVPAFWEANRVVAATGAAST